MVVISYSEAYKVNQLTASPVLIGQKELIHFLEQI